MHFDVISYVYDAYQIKFLEPNKSFIWKMDSNVPDGFIGPS
jgi:hypothetical protein